MGTSQDWQRVYEFWFPAGLDGADLQTHWRTLERWMRGGANAELPPFLPVVEAAKRRGLDHWLGTSRGRLSLIIVVDQFPRGLFAGTPDAFSLDACALQIAEEGLQNGQYAALENPWEKFFFLLPLAHAEGPDHLERMKRAVTMGELIAAEAPPHLQPLYEFSLTQARGHLEVISSFGRYPHRNSILGRASTPEEVAYLSKGDFVHTRQLPQA